MMRFMPFGSFALRASSNPETEQFAVTFAYKNPARSGLSSPDTTILGYISGRHGRAVMYFDGHIKWENNP
ncbi:MAG: hypothetical protein SFU56_15515 [Capsulimonadales bacterium]|nr:hypothetical protein [Capsulimonadales bacterium]